ncbi:hypothetical protein U1Q18_040101 [Sarracenia purpurea var. burkii]
METPSSTRRVTRSQSSAVSNCSINNIPMSRKPEDCENNGAYKSRARTGNQQDRCSLVDISNDSPIVGVAMGRLEETPLSTMSKKRSSNHSKDSKTPGSGEALLRGQVKILLQKVEEEAEISKLSLEQRPNFLHLQGLGLVNSPMGLLAPTPANTPHLLNHLSHHESFKDSCLASVTPSPVQEQLIVVSQMATNKQEGSESEKGWISRSLLLDFSEKSEYSDSSDCLSVLTNIGENTEGTDKSSDDDDDDHSVWSVLVNASSRDDRDEEENNNDGFEEEHEDEEVDELCAGMNKISIKGGGKIMSESCGRHIRFIYNSDDELEREEECGSKSEEASSTGILRLKGLPTPKGKHLRFPEEEEEEEVGEE